MSSIASLLTAQNKKGSPPRIVELPDNETLHAVTPSAVSASSTAAPTTATPMTTEQPADKSAEAQSTEKKQNLLEEFDEQLAKQHVPRVDPQWFARFNTCIHVNNSVPLAANARPADDVGWMPNGEEAFGACFLKYAPSSVKKDDGDTPISAATKTASTPLYDAGTKLAERTFVDFIPVGIITSGSADELYYWKDGVFVKLDTEALQDDKQKAAAQELAIRIVTYNWIWHGWFVAPLMTKDEKIMTSGFVGSLVSLPGSYEELVQIASRSRFCATKEDYISFSNDIRDIIRAAANTIVTALPKSGARYNVTVRDIEPETVLTSTAYMSDTYFAILVSDRMPTSDFRRDFIRNCWKFENEVSAAKKAASSDGDAKKTESSASGVSAV